MAGTRRKLEWYERLERAYLGRGGRKRDLVSGFLFGKVLIPVFAADRPHWLDNGFGYAQFYFLAGVQESVFVIKFIRSQIVCLTK